MKQVYGRRLSALVIGGNSTSTNLAGDDEVDDEDEDEDDDEEDDQASEQADSDARELDLLRRKQRSAVIPFSDNLEAKIVSVKCKAKW